MSPYLRAAQQVGPLKCVFSIVARDRSKTTQASEVGGFSKAKNERTARRIPQGEYQLEQCKS
jgi:hypothetical protein